MLYIRFVYFNAVFQSLNEMREIPVEGPIIQVIETAKSLRSITNGKYQILVIEKNNLGQIVEEFFSC